MILAQCYSYTIYRQHIAEVVLPHSNSIPWRSLVIPAQYLVIPAQAGILQLRRGTQDSSLRRDPTYRKDLK